jgi:hypothetical protein
MRVAVGAQVRVAEEEFVTGLGFDLSLGVMVFAVTSHGRLLAVTSPRSGQGKACTLKYDVMVAQNQAYVFVVCLFSRNRCTHTTNFFCRYMFVGGASA